MIGGPVAHGNEVRAHFSTFHTICMQSTIYVGCRNTSRCFIMEESHVILNLEDGWSIGEIGRIGLDVVLCARGSMF